MDEEQILNYIKNPDNEAKKIYQKLLEGYIPSQQLCQTIIQYKLKKYVNLICEYHLGAQTQNKLYDYRMTGKPRDQIINLITSSPRKKIPDEMDKNIKKSIETFVSNNTDVDKEQVEIINLYLESVKIDEEFKERILYLIPKIKNAHLKETLEVHIGINDSFLNSFIDGMFKKIRL
jgi:hypothetical protein